MTRKQALALLLEDLEFKLSEFRTREARQEATVESVEAMIKEIGTASRNFPIRIELLKMKIAVRARQDDQRQVQMRASVVKSYYQELFRKA